MHTHRPEDVEDAVSDLEVGQRVVGKRLEPVRQGRADPALDEGAEKVGPAAIVIVREKKAGNIRNKHSTRARKDRLFKVGYNDGEQL